MLWMHWLSCRRDGSHHHEWDLLWARSPIRERHIRWQIWHSELLLVGGVPNLHRSRLDSNSWMHRISNFSTADLHEERQSALSIATASNSEGSIPQRFNVDLRQSFMATVRCTITALSVSVPLHLFDSLWFYVFQLCDFLLNLNYTSVISFIWFITARFWKRCVNNLPHFALERSPFQRFIEVSYCLLIGFTQTFCFLDARRTVPVHCLQ